MKTNCTSLKEMWERLHDPNFDLMTDGFQIINDVKLCYDAVGTSNQKVLDLTQQLLLRLICNYPHVYAITVGQFPYFDDIENFWKTHGYYDTYGFLWLAPKTFGPYNMNK